MTRARFCELLCVLCSVRKQLLQSTAFDIVKEFWCSNSNSAARVSRANSILQAQLLESVCVLVVDRCFAASPKQRGENFDAHTQLYELLQQILLLENSTTWVGAGSRCKQVSRLLQRAGLRNASSFGTQISTARVAFCSQFSSYSEKIFGFKFARVTVLVYKFQVKFWALRFGVTYLSCGGCKIWVGFAQSSSW